MNRGVVESLDRSYRYIAGHQNPDGSIAVGDDPRFKVWETALGLLSLADVRAQYPQAVLAATQFLVSVRRVDGSFPHTTRPEVEKDADNYCIETTATAALALAKVGTDIGSTSAFLLSKQLHDGSWDIGIKGVREDIRKYPSVTGFALRSLRAAGVTGPAIERGVRYIASQCLDNGLWGEVTEGYDTPYYAAHVILPTLNHLSPKRTAVFDRAVTSIRSAQHPEGFWGATIPHKPSRALRTALALVALLGWPEAEDSDAVERGVGWLLSEQRADGSWDGGYFGENEPDKKEDMFATNAAVAVLQAYSASASGVLPRQADNAASPQHFDVIVVGSGPAGIAFLRTLMAKQATPRVLVLDRSKHPRIKACGDALTYLSLGLVAEIFPELAGRIPTPNFVSRYKFAYSPSQFVAGKDGALDVIPRSEFDLALWETLRGGNIETRHDAEVTGVVVEGGRLAGVTVTESTTAYRVTADLIIGADGATSAVRRYWFQNEHRAGAVAFRQYVRNVPETADGLLFRLDPRFQGYFWVFPFTREGERWANIGYYAKAGRKLRLKKRFEEFCRRQEMLPYLEGGEFRDGGIGYPVPILRSSARNVSPQGSVSGPGFLLLGDAAGLVQPHTGEGIAAALHSGKVAAELYVSGLDARDLAMRYEQGVRDFARRTYAVSGMYMLVRLPEMLPGFVRGGYARLVSWWFGSRTGS